MFSLQLLESILVRVPPSDTEVVCLRLPWRTFKHFLIELVCLPHFRTLPALFQLPLTSEKPVSVQGEKILSFSDGLDERKIFRISRLDHSGYSYNLPEFGLFKSSNR
jgi:hypothetical protein